MGSMMILGRCGRFEPMYAAKLERGMKIFGEYGQCFCDSGVFAVTEVRNDGFDMVEINGRHRFIKNHELEIQPKSKEFGIGTYWNDIEPAFRYSDNEIAEALKKAAIQKYKDDEAAKAKEKADSEDRERLLKEYSYLDRIESGTYRGITAAKNLRKILKKRFPETKFKVHQTYDSSSYEIEWTDGAALSKVSAVESLFTDTYFNGMTDAYEDVENHFAELFGSIGYLTFRRVITEVNKDKIAAEYKQKHDFAEETDEQYIRREIEREIYKTSF
jgi:hypothetical protein